MTADLQLALKSAAESELKSKLSIENLIDGKFSASGCGSSETLESFDPSTGFVWAHLPDSTADDVNLAVNAAHKAFESWSETSAEYRSGLLRRLADIVEENAQAFAVAESRDQGKPVSLAAAMDVPRCVHNLRFFASAILHHVNDSIVQHQPCTALNYVLSQPAGVAALISPWNLPLYLLSFKLAPALAAGCTVVAKPSEFTSVTAWLLAKASVEAGFPPGVFNLVCGRGQAAGEALLTHPKVVLISFTGSTAVGRHIQAVTAPFTKRLSLEMGGKNPCIVFEDADLAKAVPTIVRSCFANQGEICLCTSRLYVHELLYQRFLNLVVEEVGKIKMGDPSVQETTMGALVSEQHYEKVYSFMQLAEKEAKVLCGGTKQSLMLPEKNKKGYFLPPTIVVDVKEDSRLLKEEVFGPLVCVVPFQDEKEVVKKANNVEYGLSASIWSRDVNRVHRVAAKIQAGTVWCNCWLVRELNMPFGGIKASGIGRESAKDSIDFFTERKTVCVKLD